MESTGAYLVSGGVSSISGEGSKLDRDFQKAVRLAVAQVRNLAKFGDNVGIGQSGRRRPWKVFATLTTDGGEAGDPNLFYFCLVRRGARRGWRDSIGC